MKCSRCGKELNNTEGSKYCKFCGAELVQQEEYGNNDVGMWNVPREVRTDTLTTGCKVWFWIVLIGNGLAALLSLASLFLLPALGIISGIIGVIISIAVSVVAAVASGMILFKYSKTGLTLLIAGYVIGCLNNIIFNDTGILVAVIPAIVGSAISCYFVNKNADVIQ